MSERFANILRSDLRDGTREVLWVEVARAKSRRDFLQVNQALQADMVMGGDMAQHIEDGRASVLAPTKPTDNRGTRENPLDV